MQYEEAAAELTLVEKYNHSYTGSYNYKDSQVRLQECNSIFKTYTNEELQFSIDYPIGFDLDEGNWNQYNEIYFSKHYPHIYAQLSLGAITALDSIENSYDMKLNQVTNAETNVYYKKLYENEFVIYWRTLETEFYYRGVFDNKRDIAYFIYVDYGREDQETYDVIAKRIISSFKIQDESDQASYIHVFKWISTGCLC